MNNEEIENEIKIKLIERENLTNQIKDINAVLIYLSNKQKENKEENEVIQEKDRLR